VTSTRASTRPPANQSEIRDQRLGTLNRQQTMCATLSASPHDGLMTVEPHRDSFTFHVLETHSKCSSIKIPRCLLCAWNLDVCLDKSQVPHFYPDYTEILVNITQLDRHIEAYIWYDWNSKVWTVNVLSRACRAEGAAFGNLASAQTTVIITTVALHPRAALQSVTQSKVPDLATQSARFGHIKS
jgi:hypothetical protein